MLKLGLTIMLLVFTSNFLAQLDQYASFNQYASSSQNEYLFDSYRFYFAPIKQRKEFGITEIKAIEKKLKKNIFDTVTQRFNLAGRLISYENPKSKYTNKIEYMNDTLKTYILAKYKNVIRETFYTYKSGLISSEIRKKNNKIKFEKQVIYTTFGKVKTQITKEGRKTYMYENEYDSLKNLIKSSYFINGKVKRTWDYSCKPQGEQLVSSKTEVVSSKCEFREENRDSSYVIYVRTFKKNIPYLEAKRYSKDSVMVAYEYYKNDTMLVYNWVKDGDWTYYSLYNYKGKLKRHTRNKTVFKYKTEESLYFKKNKLKQHYKNSYDLKGNNVEQIVYNPKRLMYYSRTVFTNNEMGLTTSEEYYKKGKLVSQTEYLYKYGK